MRKFSIRTGCAALLLMTSAVVPALLGGSLSAALLASMAGLILIYNAFELAKLSLMSKGVCCLFVIANLLSVWLFTRVPLAQTDDNGKLSYMIVSVIIGYPIMILGLVLSWFIAIRGRKKFELRVERSL
jgi:hypothetical protein